MMVQRRLARGVCPDAEALAQLIDGLCDGGTRSKILGHLDRCPPCLHVFVESQRFVHTKALYAKIGRLLKRLRHALEAAGISWHELEELVGVNDMSWDLERVFASPSNPPAVSV